VQHELLRSAFSWRKIAIALTDPDLETVWGFECYRLWVLKKSAFLKIGEILGIENVYQNRGRRLWGFLLRSFFDHFLVSEFFNSHACFRQLWKAPEISSSGPGYACSLLEGSAPPPRKMLT
jgi:hypothetical protein